MSNRQERNRRKADRRRRRLLADAEALPLPDGLTLTVGLYDYGVRVGFAMRRDRDGRRHGVLVNGDRLFRHMDDVPARALGMLVWRFADPHAPLTTHNRPWQRPA